MNDGNSTPIFLGCQTIGVFAPPFDSQKRQTQTRSPHFENLYLIYLNDGLNKKKKKKNDMREGT